MDSTEFKQRGREMVDWIVNYLDGVDKLRVTPDVEPGYLKKLIPEKPPENPESWDDIMDDVEKKIMIGMTHWQHSRFHAYFPAGNSFPSLLGGMLGDSFGMVGFSWAANPACTELETIVLDWVGQMIGLPKEFLKSSPGSKGGGVIQTSASECLLNCMLAARAKGIQTLKAQGVEGEETQLLNRLMGYCSKEAHSCVEKAAMISFVKLRILEPDQDGALRGDTVRQAIEEDVANGMYPFFVSTTLGTTGATAFDNIEEIGPICEKYGAWMHIDGAYGGNCFVCPEFRYLMKGIEYASSFNMNPNKWMLVHFDCSLMWVKDRYDLTQALVVDPLYLQHSHSEEAIDYRHWGIPLSRRFRSLKLWFVIRNYGVSGIQAYIREHSRLAKVFEQLVRTDDRFEVCNIVRVGLVCFRLKGTDSLNQKLLTNINHSGKIHMVPASVNDRFIIRFAVCAPKATDDDMRYAWNVIRQEAAEILRTTMDAEIQDLRRKQLAKRRSQFVRMVSDPKLYNPKIIDPKDSQDIHEPDIEEEDENDDEPVKELPKRRPWISWPLAFVLRSGSGIRRSEDVATMAEKEVSMRFRNWNTKVTINAQPGSSTSNLSQGASSNQAKKNEEEGKDISPNQENKSNYSEAKTNLNEDNNS